MPKCKKIKNPCKICLGQVNEKTGLQCEGACQTWIHYECLNYTPGKINDIKKGVIRVTCPCPDCKTLLPKEYRTNEPYSCTNFKCPANQPPKCTLTDCPVSKCQDTEQEQSKGKGCALEKCGKKCKPNSAPLRPDSPQTFPQACRSSTGSGRQYSMSKGSSLRDIPGDFGSPQGQRYSNQDASCALEQMCATVGQLTGQITELMFKMREHLQDQTGRNRGQQGSSSQHGPCYCPGNPCRK